MERSLNACFGDPQLTLQQLQEATELSREDVEDALYELSGMVQVSLDRVLPKDALFATFDRFWKSWDPAKDGLRLAADLMNDEHFPKGLPKIAQRYGWEPRRLNSAVAYLINRDAVESSKTLGTQPWITAWIRRTADTRRFVRSRS